MKGKDAYQRFELNLPFARVECVDFWGVIVRAHAACGSDGWVTVKALREQLNNEHWAALDNPDSTLVKILQSQAFKDNEADPAQTEEQIDYKTLATYSILNCFGDAKNKVEVFFNIIQDGGVNNHPMVSASDKDFPPFWNNLLMFATLYLFEFTEKHCGIKNNHAGDYDAIKKAIEDDDDYDSMQGGVFLTNVFGDESKLVYEDWRAAIIKHTPYLFDPDLLRKEIFKFAKVKYNPEE